jgi:hypothetical protein
MKTVAFTVRATEKQSLQWRRAADGEGHRAVGTWLAEAADRYLEAVARAGKLVPMGWRRKGVFSVRLPSHKEMVSVEGAVSHPFAYYRGTDAGADRYSDFYTLVYFPSGRIIATLRSAAQCRSLASELARLWVRWGGSEPIEDPRPVIDRHQWEDV